MKKKVRLALLGGWHVHTEGFIEKLDAFSKDKVEWKAVWDHDQARGERFAEKLQVPFVPKLEDILEDTSVDAVMIEAETNLHHELITMAARAGKHIFTDKLLAPTMEEAEDIRWTVRKEGVKFVISHESLTIRAYQYAKEEVEKGNLGELVSIYFRRSHGLAKTDVLPASWYEPETAGGGALMDLGVHGLSLLAYIGSAPETISAVTRYISGKQVEDSASIQVTFQDKQTIGQAHTNLVTAPLDNLLEITGTEGSLLIYGEKEPLIYQSSGQDKPSRVDVQETGEVPVNKFIDLVLGEENQTELTGSGLELDTAVTIVQMAEGAYKSVKQQGKPVVLK
ncbi:Gfo/Idh/MocA family protein [Alkalicoccus daliensis]|uniref:Predicted dehydrogenase n=1 Tax=Alkalicoccus daliensis TaxID=745820 RepID=A0A1H0JLD6_9BACI|nr:Gfo/Idh/MocA family oxidoreductase [Alkalicoccus daliensis]SDO44597.1 Predicted dehydrogenase [Alkalicoccus daliensis]